MSYARAAGLQGERTLARDAAKVTEGIQRATAARTVAGHALDARDCSELLSILGLQAADGIQQAQLARQAVAE